MRREEKSFRFSILIFAVIAVVISLLIGLLISRGVKNSKENEFAGQMSKLSEDLSQADTVSSQIGKSKEEAEKEIEEQEGFEVPTLNVKEGEENKDTKSAETSNVATNKKNETKNTNTKKNEPVETNLQNTENSSTKKEETDNIEKNNSVQTNSTNIDKKEEKIEMEAPIKGEIIREFAKDSLVFSNTLQEWVTHNGVDIKADKTSVVKSAAKGTVAAIKNDPRYGLTIIINHDNGYQTIYSNLLTTEFVVKGENVEIGQSIGTVGNSASFEIEDEYHLHFELIKDNEYLNPTEFMNF